MVIFHSHVSLPMDYDMCNPIPQRGSAVPVIRCTTIVIGLISQQKNMFVGARVCPLVISWLRIPTNQPDISRY